MVPNTSTVRRTSSKDVRRTKFEQYVAMVHRAHIPDNIRTSKFIEALDQFAQHRIESKWPITWVSLQQILKKCSEWGPDVAVEALNNSVLHGWRGIFEPRRAQHARAVKQVDGTTSQKAGHWSTQCKPTTHENATE